MLGTGLTLDIIEDRQEIHLTFEDVWERCWKRMEGAINEYDKTHEKNFDNQPQEWQIEYLKPIIGEVMGELEEKRSSGFHSFFV